jgi:hypothetical protein
MYVYTVYKTTNKVNERYYIGVHKTTNPYDDYVGSGKLLKRAIEKYGIEHFTKEVLFIFGTPEEAFTKEKELVTVDLLESGECYNLKVGGEGGWDHVNTGCCSDKNKRYDDNYQKLVSPFSNQERFLELDEATRKRIIDGKNVGRLKGLLAMKEYWNNNKEVLVNRKSFLGKKHTEETKKKMSESAMGKHSGKLNSQYGSFWITNEIDNKKLKIGETIPDGWRKGRRLK